MTKRRMILKAVKIGYRVTRWIPGKGLAVENAVKQSDELIIRSISYNRSGLYTVRFAQGR